MGIPALWQKLGEGEVVDIAAFAARHFEKHKRPLDIAIDEAIWRKKYFQSDEAVARIRRDCPPANPNEKAFLWRIVQLQRLNCRLVFVTDGPGRPKKRGHTTHSYNDFGLGLLKELVDALGCVWHRAPGEAEAECVQLQKLGLVDVVWTEDADALMFGAHTVLRFNYKVLDTGRKKKDNFSVRVYRTSDILRQYTFLTREAMVLFAVLVGADYDQQGLPQAGPEIAMGATQKGLREALYKVSDEGTLLAWREQLESFLRELGSKVLVPVQFPSPTAVRNYHHPLVSDGEDLRTRVRAWWSSSYDDAIVRPLLSSRFNLWIPESIELIAPINSCEILGTNAPWSGGQQQVLPH